MSTSDMSVSASMGTAVQDAKAAAAQQSKAPEQASTPKAEVQAPAKAQLTVDPEEKRRVVKETIAEMNRMMESQGRNLGFQVDDVANRTVVTVRHRETGEVVRQIPDETVLRVAHSIEAMKGLMHDSSA